MILQTAEGTLGLSLGKVLDFATFDFRSFCSVRIPIMIGGKTYCVFSSIKKVKSFFYYFVVSSFLIIFAPNYKRL